MSILSPVREAARYLLTSAFNTFVLLPFYTKNPASIFEFIVAFMGSDAYKLNPIYVINQSRPRGPEDRVELGGNRTGPLVRGP